MPPKTEEGAMTSPMVLYACSDAADEYPHPSGVSTGSDGRGRYYGVRGTTGRGATPGQARQVVTCRFVAPKPSEPRESYRFSNVQTLCWDWGMQQTGELQWPLNGDEGHSA